MGPATGEREEHPPHRSMHYATRREQTIRATRLACSHATLIYEFSSSHNSHLFAPESNEKQNTIYRKAEHLPKGKIVS
jgi:hypothetical protein